MTARTLAERLFSSIGTGHEEAELTVLDTLDNVTATATEINVLASATNANATTGKAAILGTSGALTIAGSLTVGTTTISEAEIGVLDSAAASNAGTGKAVILGTSGALTIAGTLTSAGMLVPPVSVTDATPYAVLAADTGKTHILPDFSSSCTLNLPATATSGLKYTFKSKAVAADAQNWVIVATTPAFFKGGVAWLDNDAGPAAAETKTVFPNGSSHLTLTVVTPSGGTFITVEADGTNWIVSGMVNSATTPAFT